MPRPIGTPVWIDLSSHRLEEVLPFYRGLFGWEVTEPDAAHGGYRMLSHEGGLVGGAMDVSAQAAEGGAEIPAAWSVYLAVDDVRARLATALEHGAREVAGAHEVGEAGSFAVIADPTGAVVGMWQAGELAGFAGGEGVGAPVWFELTTRLFEQSQEFYGAVFDAQFTAMGADGQSVPEPAEVLDDLGSAPDQSGFRYATCGAGEDARWGLYDARGFMPTEPTGWSVCFEVDSCDDAVARVRALGGAVLSGPTDSPFGRIATIAAPEGVIFQVIATSEATDPA